MKTSLYELSDNYYQALDFLTDPENDIDDQTLLDTVEGLDGEIDDKITAVGKFIVSIENQAAGITEAEKRMKYRRQALDKKADWLRLYLSASMQKIGKTKVTAPDIAVSLAKLPASVRIIDESLIPKEFFRTKVIQEPNKTAIKDSGGCAGVVIVTDGYRVSIK